MSTKDCVNALVKIARNRVPKIRNIRVNHRRTSVRLEDGFWAALEEIATQENMSVHDIATTVAKVRSYRENAIVNLSSALRLFTLTYYRSKDTREQQRSIDPKPLRVERSS
jgi:predicted DNA-binding ribbon-helix-helix protein